MRYVLAQIEPTKQPTMNNTSSTMSENFKATYLRLLSGGTPDPSDYWAVPELINAGLAQGDVLAEATTGKRLVTKVLNFAPTVQGRLMADDLAEAARKKTLRHRLMQLLFGASTFGAGWVFGVLNQVVANLLTKSLGG